MTSSYRPFSKILLFFDKSSLVNRLMEVKPNEQYTINEVDALGEDSTISEDEDILHYDDVDDHKRSHNFGPNWPEVPAAVNGGFLFITKSR